MTERPKAVAVDQIRPRILLIRGQRVLLDADLAVLYGSSTKALNQAVKRNARRFPADFAFRLTPEEKAEVVTKCDHLQRLKYSPQLPNAFTEHGAIMAATVLNTARAIEVSVHVVRTFVRLREMVAAHKGLADRLALIEQRTEAHAEAIRSLMAAVRELMAPPPSSGGGSGSADGIADAPWRRIWRLLPDGDRPRPVRLPAPTGGGSNCATEAISEWLRRLRLDSRVAVHVLMGGEEASGWDIHVEVRT